MFILQWKSKKLLKNRIILVQERINKYKKILKGLWTELVKFESVNFSFLFFLTWCWLDRKIIIQFIYLFNISIYFIISIFNFYYSYFLQKKASNSIRRSIEKIFHPHSSHGTRTRLNFVRSFSAQVHLVIDSSFWFDTRLDCSRFLTIVGLSSAILVCSRLPLAFWSRSYFSDGMMFEVYEIRDRSVCCL